MKICSISLGAAALLAISATGAGAFGLPAVSAGAHRVFAGPHAGPQACLQGSQRACERLGRLGRLQPLSRDQGLQERRIDERTVIIRPSAPSAPQR